MGKLADDAAAWQNRGDRYAVRRSQRLRLPDFWTKEGGRNQRFGWGELNNSLGFALGVHRHHERLLLHVHLVWPGVWINIGRAKEDDEPFKKWGVSIGGGPSLYFGWGRKSKFVYGPWRLEFVRGEWMHADGTWRVEPRTRYRRNMSPEARDAAWKQDTDARDTKEAECWQVVEDWRYRSRACDLQEGTALISVERRTWRQWWLRWTPLFQKQATTIDVKFSREVGNRAGSWKGGTIGCGYDMKPGESPTECFHRMMQKRDFDR